MNRIPIVIDVDTGCDDAIEIIQATLQKELNVLGITCVAGNTTMHHVLQNTYNVLSFIQEDIPVYRGCEKPLKRILQTASFHGVNGLGDIDIPDVSYCVDSKSAIEFMYENILEYKHEIVLLFSGPLTNAAVLLKKYPEVKDYIKEIVFMGGSISYGGNVSKYAEFNTFTDPEAAQIVLESSVPCRMIGLDVTMIHGMDLDSISEYEGIGAVKAELVSKVLRYLETKKDGDGRIHLHDVMALLSIVHPEYFVFKNGMVSVELDNECKRGMTIADFNNIDSNCAVAMDIDGDMYWDWFKRSLII